MKLELVAHTPDIETMIATSMLSTTSGALPGTLYKRLLENAEKVNDIVGRVEVQHGNILEHNRLVWKLTAPESTVLEVMLDSKYFNFTRVADTTWVMSCNLRTIVEYSQSHSGEFTDILVESIKEVSPHIYEFIRRRGK